MRRQARISAGGALVVRTASALQVWLWLLIFIFQNEFRISISVKPGYLDFDNLPETNFTCAGKVIGGYYADLETSCQMFHVCTVGQQDEPMDIKFLCLNGTVFDQETRVCERVDEVDCTKSEKFYSLNLELYGSTAPPIIQPEEKKPQAQSTEQSHHHAKPNDGEETGSAFDDIPTTIHDKIHIHSTEVTDSTEDPVQEIQKDDHNINPSTTQDSQSPPSSPDHDELTEEYQEDDENTEYDEEEDYVHPATTTTIQASTTTTTTTTTTTKPTTTTSLPGPAPSLLPSSTPHFYSSPSPALPSISSSGYPSLSSSIPPLPTLDPALLSPQEFIYRHQGPGSEAISFQRHSFRPADGVFITHAPPQQFDHFQYESSRTAPRPAPFIQRPQPAPFRPTTLDPRDQLLRPGPTFQPSERHETSIKHNKQTYPSALPAQRPLPFNPFYYDRKRSDDSVPDNKSSLSARSVAPPTITERPLVKPKSPPRVIVTASASVSDSNGKRLNYTVGNVVSAVKPIVAINYDDYKESDLIFDPFFLDVPKLQNRRKTRSNEKRQIITVPATAAVISEMTSEKPISTSSKITSRATTTESSTIISSNNKGTTTAWNPNDYVDDNYEPHAYVPPIPPLAILVPQDRNKFNKQERHSVNDLVEEKARQDDKPMVGRTEQYRPTPSALQTSSSQSAGTEAAPAATAPAPPTPLQAPACATSRFKDCRTRV